MILEQIAIFIIFLGPLVFFHELGHFLFARLFGVRVEVFSLGFGPKIFKKKKNDTEYAISIIPLGGYVKMFGDDPMKKDEIPEEDRKYSFTHKSKWAKFWIVFGGPLANFILAYFIYFALLVGGEKVPEPKIGLIPQNSQYYQIGFRTADVLVQVNQKEVLGFDDLNLIDSDVDTVIVQRGNSNIKIDVGYPAQKFVNDIMSFPHHFRAPFYINKKGEKFLVSANKIKAKDNSSKENNKFFSLADVDIKSDSIEEYMRLDSNVFYIYPVLDDKISLEFEILEVAKSYNEELMKKGLFPVDLMINSIVMDSPADKSLLKKDDIIFKINGETLYSFSTLRETVQNIKDGESATIEFFRDSKLKEVKLQPEMNKVGDEVVMTIGIYSSVQQSRPRMIESSQKPFGSSILVAFTRTIEGMEKTVMGFVKLITAQASMKNIGGPVAIAKVAADSLSISLSYFFRLMAIISINLGIINLFPIPVLDGGHIMFLILEVVNRGPLSQRKMEIAQQFGVSLLLLLVTVALYNDFSRIFS